MNIFQLLSIFSSQIRLKGVPNYKRRIFTWNYRQDNSVHLVFLRKVALLYKVTKNAEIQF